MKIRVFVICRFQRTTGDS